MCHRLTWSLSAGPRTWGEKPDENGDRCRYTPDTRPVGAVRRAVEVQVGESERRVGTPEGVTGSERQFGTEERG